jgi:hypothetical protein
LVLATTIGFYKQKNKHKKTMQKAKAICQLLATTYFKRITLLGTMLSVWRKQRACSSFKTRTKSNQTNVDYKTKLVR